MNSFGLGLVLNFVDNASAGMNSATNNFMRMSATADSMTSSVSASATEMAAIAFSLSAVGDTFVSIGESLTGVFAGITQQVIDAGMSMQGYRMQLKALYGDSNAESVMQEIVDYAKKSVFEIQSLIPAVTMMKAVGIEAMQEVTTSNGKSTQRLLDYASDIAAMVPNMRNIYGTGVKAAMGALKEYIAEGNALSLKRGAGLDITGILGEEKGATVEERTQQIADLVEKLNILGYTERLQKTPTQRLSNLQDVLFETLTKIADSGVFDTYCTLLANLSDWIFNVSKDEETFNAITGVLADTITTMLSPLQSMLDWVIANSDAIINWIKENPKLVRNILVTVAAVGAFLIVGGSLLKMLSSIAFAMSGLQVLKAIPKLFSKVIFAVLPFIAIAGIAYTVWKNNIGGIRDTVTDLMTNLGDIFSVLSDAWGDNTLSEENFLKAKELGIMPFIEGILQLKYYWDYFVEGFKTGFTSFFESLTNVLSNMGIDISALGEAFVGFLKMLTQPGAEEEWSKLGETMGALVGIMASLALITKIIMPVIKVLVNIGKAVKWVFDRIWDVAKAVKNLFIMIKSSGLGAKIAGFFSKIGGFFSKFSGLFVKIGGAFSKLGGWIASGAKVIGSAIMSALTAVAAFLGVPVWVVVAIAAAIATAITLIIVFRDEIAKFFVWLWGKITEFFPWLWGVISNAFVELWNIVSTWFIDVFNKVKEFISNIIQAILNNPIVQSIIKVLQSIFNVISGVVSTIVTFIVGVAQVIWSVIKMIGTFIAGVAKVIWSVISGVVNAIWSFIKGLANFIVTVALGIWNVIQAVANFIWTLIKTVADIIMKIVNAVYQFFRMIFLAILAVAKVVITAIVNFFKGLWEKIKSIVQAIGDFFNWTFNWVKNNVITPVVDWIVFAFNWVKDRITEVLTAIGNFFSTIFNWINDNVITPFRDFIGMVFDWISDKVDAVTSWMADAFETVADWIMNVFNGVADFFTGIWKAISDTAGAFFDWIAEKLGAVTEVLSAIGNFFGGIIGGIGDFFGGIGDSIAGFVGLDTGGYVKTTGLAVLHPNEVVVNDDTTKRLQNFLGKYENNSVNGIVSESTPTQAVMNNIYPTVMESVPVTTVPADEVSNVNNNSLFETNNTQNFVTQNPTEVIEKSGEIHNDYSVTFATGSIVIQLANTSDAELEKTAEKLMRIIARKQQLRAMAIRV